MIQTQRPARLALKDDGQAHLIQLKLGDVKL
jgi:hypothetical protein